MKTLVGAVTLSLLAWVVPANAVTFQTLGGQQWTAPDTSNLTLSATPTPTANQPRDTPCIICGENQPQQPDGFGYTNFGNKGNEGNLIYFSSGIVGDKDLGFDSISGTNYSGAFLTNFLLGAGDLDLNFSIGIDMNDTKVAQTLESFFFLNLTQHTILAAFSPEPGGVALPSLHNGTGFADYLLSGLTLSGINAGDQLAFYARISGANDGPDSFFLRATPSVVPLPAGVWLFGSAIAGLSALKIRRRRRANSPA
jgi:hypothetical protein